MQSMFSRRDFLALGAAAALPALAQAPRTKPYKIDVHHHFLPPRHVERILALRESGRPPQWSPELSLEQMDQNGVATSIASLVQPGIWFGNNDEARGLAR